MNLDRRVDMVANRTMPEAGLRKLQAKMSKGTILKSGSRLMTAGCVPSDP